MKTAKLQRLISDKGFTKVELIVGISVIVIVAALLSPSMKKTTICTVRGKCMAELSGIDTAIKAYFIEYGKLPTQASDLGLPDRTYGPSQVFEITNILRKIDRGGTS